MGHFSESAVKQWDIADINAIFSVSKPYTVSYRLDG